MKKIIVIALILMNVVSVNASSNIPKYKIVANSNSEKDIKKMYKIKNDLINDYRNWANGVIDIDQVLADHQNDYDAIYYNGEYKIILGKGKGKTLTGELKVSYCTSSKEIKKKSFFAELFS